MNFPFPFLALFLLFIVATTFLIKKSDKKSKQEQDAFWAREAEANNTRSADISGLPYIQIPVAYLPFCETDDTEINRCQELVRELSHKSILNLTGISNTELKLTYGTANIQFLSECDENFATLCCILQDWAVALSEINQKEETQCLLEYAIGWGSDIKASYLLLAELYFENGQFDQIDSLIKTAQTLHSLSKPAILEALSQF